MLLGLALTACIGLGAGHCEPVHYQGPTAVAPHAEGAHVHHAEHGEHHHGHQEPDGCEHECVDCCQGHAPAAATVPPGVGVLSPVPPCPRHAIRWSVVLDPPPVRILHVPRPIHISG